MTDNTEYQEITITFKYRECEEFDKWFKENVQDRICAVTANKDKAVQCTAWSTYNLLDQFAEIREAIENDR